MNYQFSFSESHVNWSITKLLDVLQSLGNTENLTIKYLDICLDNDFDEQVTENIFRTGIKI